MSGDHEQQQNMQRMLLLMLWKANGRSKKSLVVTGQDQENMLRAFDGGPPVLWTEHAKEGVRFRLISVAEAQEIAAAGPTRTPAETLQ